MTNVKANRPKRRFSINGLFDPGPQSFRTRRTCAGTKASWGGTKQVGGDQKAGGPENLLALRAEGTRVPS